MVMIELIKIKENGMELDLHGVRHPDVEMIVENYVLIHSYIYYYIVVVDKTIPLVVLYYSINKEI